MQGRTNKLVDGCYSFWQGGLLPLLHKMVAETGDKNSLPSQWLFDQTALQEYLLICCQVRILVDKLSFHIFISRICAEGWLTSLVSPETFTILATP